MNKIVIQIGLELVWGPLLKDQIDKNGRETTGISFVDNDEIICKLNDEANKLWISLFSNDDSETSGFKFDTIREKEIAPKLLELISQLVKRLEEINDGSYEIWDTITEHLKELIV